MFRNVLAYVSYIAVYLFTLNHWLANIDSLDTSVNMFANSAQGEENKVKLPLKRKKTFLSISIHTLVPQGMIISPLLLYINK